MTFLRSPFSCRSALVALASVCMLTATAAHASAAETTYPTKAITLVIPFPPGGPTDVIARMIAQKISESMGQPVLVDNRAGANGNLAAMMVVKAPADGYTLLYNTSSIALSSALYKNLSYDVTRDLSPVILTAVVPLALVVTPNLPVNSVQEFIDYAKANPGRLSYGSAGTGNVTHLGAFQFLHAKGIDAIHIPYKGSAPANVDLVSGQIHFMTDTVNTIAAFVRDQRMKILAVTTAKRMSMFPSVPTLAESGMPGFEIGAWQGIMVPKGTPEFIIERLNTEVMKALQSQDIRQKLALQGAEPLGSTPSGYGEYLHKEITRWSGVVKQIGITSDP